MLRALREATGAPLQKCKDAAIASEGNIDQAIALLKKQGLAVAAKKSERNSSEGILSVYNGTDGSTIIEINSETDFLAKNPKFQDLGASISQSVYQYSKNLTTDKFRVKVDSDSVDNIPFIPDPSISVKDAITDFVLRAGENIQFRFGISFFRDDALPGSIIGSFLHANKTGALVALGPVSSNKQLLHEFLSSPPSNFIDDMKALGNQLSIHVMGCSPQYLDRSSIPQDFINQEIKVLVDNLEQSMGAKPRKGPTLQQIAFKQLEKRFFSEQCLLDQEMLLPPHLLDSFKNPPSVSQYLKEYEFQLGLPSDIHLSIFDFTRIHIGDGLEKTQSNFAQEVAQQMGLA